MHWVLISENKPQKIKPQSESEYMPKWADLLSFQHLVLPVCKYLLAFRDLMMKHKIQNKCVYQLFFAAVYYHDCVLVSKTQMNHNTFMFRLQFPRGTVAYVPVGKHVYLKAQIQGK